MALPETEFAFFHRFMMPEWLRNLQYRLHVGNEKRLRNAWKAFNEFIYNCIDKKWKELNNKNVSLLSAFMRELKDQTGTSGNADKFLRDTLLSLMFAGTSSNSVALAWFFYLLLKNPIVEDKIREEIHTHLEIKDGERWKKFGVNDLGRLVYLHGALCETLRLFPLPFQVKTPIQADILPSGHKVDQQIKVIMPFYCMGRMESIWGEDCMEFRPERWINKGGGIKHEPSYKFTAFNAGPRTCLGKDMAFTQMKIVAAVVIYNYHVELVEGHPVMPSDSILVQMKYGLKVKLGRKNIRRKTE